VRIRGRDGEKNQWLILKTGDDAKPISSKLDDESVKTGRTMKEIADARDAEWQSGRAEDQSPTSQFKARIREAVKKKAKDEPVGKAHSRAVVSAKALGGGKDVGNRARALQQVELTADALPVVPGGGASAH
jgi:hypothetical protein